MAQERKVTKIYVVETEDGCFYIGKTHRSVDTRLAEHIAEPSNEWLKIHKAKQLAAEPYEGDGFDEDAEFLRWVHLKGIERVRGGGHTKVVLDPLEIRRIHRRIAAAIDGCLVCCKYDHWVDQCPVRCYRCQGAHYADECHGPKRLAGRGNDEVRAYKK